MMKRLFIIVMVIVMLLSGIAAAEKKSYDLDAMTQQQILELKYQVDAALLRDKRGPYNVSSSAWRSYSLPAGTYIVGKDIPAGRYYVARKVEGTVVEFKVYKGTPKGYDRSYSLTPTDEMLCGHVFSDKADEYIVMLDPGVLLDLFLGGLVFTRVL